MTWDEAFEKLDALTSDAGCWSIQWNDQRSYYNSVQHELSNFDDDHFSFENEDEKLRAIAENKLVIIHWYNHTPVGSYKLAAPDMVGLLRCLEALFEQLA